MLRTRVMCAPNPERRLQQQRQLDYFSQPGRAHRPCVRTTDPRISRPSEVDGISPSISISTGRGATAQGSSSSGADLPRGIHRHEAGR